MHVLVDGLAVAGEGGTLVNRFVGTALQGHLRAKDGFLDGVAAMAGILDIERPLSFALIVNGVDPFDFQAAEAIETGVLTALASYSEGPPGRRVGGYGLPGRRVGGPGPGPGAG